MALPKLLSTTLQLLEDQRSALLAALVGCPPEKVTAAPSKDAWSVSQVVDHLLLAEGFTNDITSAMADTAAQSGRVAGFPQELSALAPLPAPKGMEAPAPIRPRRALVDLEKELRGMQSRTMASFDALTSIDPREYIVPHPLFGELGLGQWWCYRASITRCTCNK